MGYALARAAQGRGARVILISGPTHLPAPAKVERISVQSAAEMREAVLRCFPDATMLIMAAAVSDYRPRQRSEQKLKKDREPLFLELEPTTDILAEVRSRRSHQILIGFAAETENVLNRARTKLEQKGLDLIVANDLTQEGAGFDLDTNVVTFIDANGDATALPKLSKAEVAERILDRIKELKSRMGTGNRPVH
jgi:phosphopantothenoylcysteine decarboxylase/phosphopantothenate--cysteine ligase